MAGQRARLLALLPRRSCWWQSFPRGGMVLGLEELAAVPSGREDAGGGGLSRRHCEPSAAQRPGSYVKALITALSLSPTRL